MIRLPIALLLTACAAPALPLPPWTAHGREVVWEHRHLDGHAGSEWRAGLPIVYLDDDMDELAPSVQWWVAAHEVCHLLSERTELEADCCATTWMAVAGWLDDVALVSELQTWPGSATHPTGTERAAHVLECAALAENPAP